MSKMSWEDLEFKFKFQDKFLTAKVTRFINKDHKIVPDFRVYVREPAPHEREHVFTFYITGDKHEPLFWFPLKNKVEMDMAEAISHVLYKKQLTLDM